MQTIMCSTLACGQGRFQFKEVFRIAGLQGGRKQIDADSHESTLIQQFLAFLKNIRSPPVFDKDLWSSQKDPKVLFLVQFSR